MNQVAQTTSQKIEVILPELKKLPQVNCFEKHYFGPSLYIKEVTMPAGSVIVGKPHKVEHMCVMLQGKMVLVAEDGSKKEVCAPMTFIGTPGRKVAYILETTVFQNIYATEETDVEKLENMFVENSQRLLEKEI
jgi:hypothetical protein